MKWMTIWKPHIRQQPDPYLKEKQLLLEEIQTALLEWENAQRRLDYVVEKDQIDYTIYMIEAAEKRYEMLLRNAKQLNLHVLEVGHRKAAEG